MGPHINMSVKFRKLLKARKGVGTIIATVMIIVTIIFLTLNTTLWANKTTTTMAESDSDRRLENVTFTNSWTNTNTTVKYPSSYSIPNGTLVSGGLSDVQAVDTNYLTVSSQMVTLPPTLYAHREQTAINRTSYYQFKRSGPDSAVLNLTVWNQYAGRYCFGGFLYPLANQTLPVATWTFYYYAAVKMAWKWIGAAHCDVDILIRKADGSIRSIIATDVATASVTAVKGDTAITYSLVSGTYSFPGYSVVDPTDYLEIDYYIHYTTSGNEYLYVVGSLLVEDATNPTRVTGGTCYLVNTKFDFSGVKADQLVLNIVSLYSVGSVTCRFLMFNYTARSWVTLLTYTSSSTANTKEWKSVTITTADMEKYVSGGKANVTVQATHTATFNQMVDRVKFDVFRKDISFTFTNRGPKTTHLVALWVLCPTPINGTSHNLYTAPQFDLLINVTKPKDYTLHFGWVSGDKFTFKVVTELGSNFNLNATAS